MRRLLIAVMTAASLLLLALPAACLAQTYRPDRLQAYQSVPNLNLSLSSASIQALDAEFDDDFRALDAFAGGKRGIDRFAPGHVSAGGWKFYGRVYLVNFQNPLGEPLSGMQFSWRRTGPGIPKSRIYFAVHRQF